MTRQAIFEKVVAIAAEYLEEGVVLTEESSVQDGFADSVQLMEFIISLEDAFDIEISDDAADQFSNLGSVVDYIEANIS
ncbi:phosphopantetheine-binding protein [Streptococcus merionis]|uniref:phosphopantetheine-binding protein n=1 Tax=Streptococcus merionis TaxID=400065 RepID=UPI0026EF7AC4|nr:phosphopantetheine-binding protein [Streptococcus merionis]